MQHAPVSAGSVRTLIALIRAVMTISGLVILSQYLQTGLNAGSGWRDAKVSAGNTRSGILFTVAVAHAVTMFAAPGPMEEAHAMIFLRLLCFAKAVAT